MLTHLRPRWRSLAAIPAMLALLALPLLCASSADAFIQRGHVFAGSFGELPAEKGVEKAGGKENLAKPSAIAVDEASTGEGAGDIYVLERANNRVAVYGPEHKFKEAWGFGVKTGGEALERCEAECRAGKSGFAKGQLDNPVAIAVDSSNGDPSSHDVYVVANRTWKHALIDKFSPKGELVSTLLTKKEEKEDPEGPIDGVAVNSHGTVLVEREEEEDELLIESFTDEEKNELIEGSQVELETPQAELTGVHRPVRPGFALDGDNVYVNYEPFGEDLPETEAEEEAIATREKERKAKHEALKFEQPREDVGQWCEEHRCIATELSISEDEPVVDEFGDENTTGLALDPASGDSETSDNLYLDSGTGVAAFTSGGSPIQRFGSEQLHDAGGSGLTVDAASGEVLVTDAAGGRIDLYTREPVAAPAVEPGSVRFAHAQSSSVELRATISPAGGVEPRYRFQYGTVSCASSPGSCALAPAEGKPAKTLQEGFEDQLASVKLEGLAPSTIYHFRVIAENGEGSTTSEEATFTTQPSAVEASLLDGRAWELVSEPDKHGGAIYPIELEGGLIQAAKEGGSIAYTSNAPVGENEAAGYRGPEPTEIVSKRDGTTWSSQDIATENGVPAQGLQLGGPWEYQFFSTELERALVDPYALVPPSRDTKASEQTLYVREMETCASSPETCYVPIVSAANTPPGTEFGESELKFQDATPDLEHAVISSNSAALTATAAPKQTALYEWSKDAPPAEQLQLVSVLPNKTEAVGSGIRLGAFNKESARSGALADDGARVIWSTGHHLYMRELATPENGKAEAETVKIDEPDTGVSNLTFEQELAVFQGANADGSKVFFTDSERLTKLATHGGHEDLQDLYVFEREKPAGERVTDLGPDIVNGEGAAVQGGVLGISTDGSYVYFVADGVLAAGAERGDCTEEAFGRAACNLYVAHDGAGGWEPPHFIARLSSEDSPDWGKQVETGESHYAVQKLTAQVSSNGEYVAFMSSRSLTGYDNIDANSGHADEEVYLYHYGAPTPTCVSCNPSGAQPVGVLDTQDAGEGIGLVVDRPETWESGHENGELEGVDSWLAGNLPGWTAYGLPSHGALYQSRYLSNEGRLFFNSADALVPVADPTRTEKVDGEEKQVGVENVYEYEPKGLGSCETENTQGGCVALVSSGETGQESAFVDASENGDDVFFVTNEKLSPLDTETTLALYDARVCKGTAEPCAPPPPEQSEACTGQPGHECREVSEAGPVFQAPASAASDGSQNIVAQGAVLPAKEQEKPKPKQKPLTRAQKLAAALKACKKDKKKVKRMACEKQARKKYGAKASRAKKSGVTSTHNIGIASRTRA